MARFNANNEELIKLLRDQMAQQQQQMEMLMSMVAERSSKPQISTTKFCEFDPSGELWTDYWSRYSTFVKANSIPQERMAEIFLTNQSSAIYKLLTNLAAQSDPPKDINSLTMDEIQHHMADQHNPKRFVVRERYKFWSRTERKSGESIQALAARIRQEAATCDFSSIKDPLDEAMRTRFVCSIDNEAIIKALFKIKDDELSFNRAIEIAAEVEEATKVAKETLGLGSPNTEVFQMRTNQRRHQNQRSRNIHVPSKEQKSHQRSHKTGKGCYRCQGQHAADSCKFKESVCHHCGIKGHIKSACRKRQKPPAVKRVTTVKWNAAQPLMTTCYLNGTAVKFEVDTGSRDSIISRKIWKKLNQPPLTQPSCKYRCASNVDLPVVGMASLMTSASKTTEGPSIMQKFVVTNLDLNLLGRSTIKELGLSVDQLIHAGSNRDVHQVKAGKADKSLQSACKQLCEEFPDLFKPELGTFKDFELEVRFKQDATPVFHRPRTVPIAIQEDLDQALQAGISKGIWEVTKFNEYGTPVVPVKKKTVSGQRRPTIRVCGDYSVTVNQQLEPHRHPMPSPEDLMRRLGRGHGFTKIDLADAYNQICLGPESQKKLALSTNKGVLLQKRLPFGITSAPGYFQEIMDRLTQDLPGVAVYLDDILVSGDSAEMHLSNLRGLLQRLQDTGLRCKLEKCEFAQPSVEYLGHNLSRDGISKGSKASTIQSMPAPKDVSSLRSFLGQVQFYSKFLSNVSTVLEPLYNLTKKDVPWKWGKREQTAFVKTKEMLASDVMLAHCDPSLEVGISCDASEVGIGAVLFHRYPDGSERPIANASKTMSSCQRNYSQIQREALAIIFALNKFHQFLYGRKFILVTDHKPLISLFGPTKPIPALAANRLARWALTLSQYDYKIEYRRTADHGNADALSRLPSGPDLQFDKTESGDDTSTICTIKMVSPQPDSLVKKTQEDPVLSTVIGYTQHGWPKTTVKGGNGVWSESSFQRIKDYLTSSDGCLFYGDRVVVPRSLQKQILDILHLGHFGVQRMKQLARTAVYWPGIDSDIMDTTRGCTSCMENQKMPPKQPVHPWITPDGPWQRVHIDHAVNFKGHNWLVMVDAYSKYPCVHQMSSITSKATMKKLDEDFAHFGYPCTIVTDNAQCFSSEEFSTFCRERGIQHLQGAPYHPETNGAAERLVQSFKTSLKKSSRNPQDALQEFLIQYRRTPLPSGSSPGQLLNGRQIRTQIDIVVPQKTSPGTGIQRKRRAAPEFVKDSPCYALSFRRGRKDKWVPAVISKIHGSRLFEVKTVDGLSWRRHLDQLRPRHM